MKNTKTTKSKSPDSVIIVGAILTVILSSIIGYLLYANNETSEAEKSSVSEISESEPNVTVNTIASGLQKPWDVTFLPSGVPLFTENDGTVSLIVNEKVRRVATLKDVDSSGEGGLTGAAVDPNFTKNRKVYLCYNTNKDVRVVSMKLDTEEDELSEKKVIVLGIPSNTSGRHSGCRVAFGPDKYLWIGTGDAAMASNPQDPKSLAGKILRVTTNGKPAPGNLDGTFDPRVYSYGHRNIQGLAFFKQQTYGISGYSVEHGSDIDDEVNPLKKGNFGWDPKPPYIESGVLMTDLEKYPNAVKATWSSGDETQAPSGAEILYGDKWKSWDGALAIAMLKEQHLKIFTFNDDGSIKNEFRILKDKGRIRDVEQAPDGSLYVTTDNGAAQDVVLRLEVEN